MKDKQKKKKFKSYTKRTRKKYERKIVFLQLKKKNPRRLFCTNLLFVFLIKTIKPTRVERTSSMCIPFTNLFFIICFFFVFSLDFY